MRKSQIDAKKIPEWLRASAATPICFDQEDWDRWREATISRSICRLALPKSICEDCLPERQQAMLAVNRCTHPEVTFHRDNDGFISGKHPLKGVIKRCQNLCDQLGVCQGLPECWDKKTSHHV